MGNLIVLEEREVKAKGLNKEHKIDFEKVNEYLFDEDIPRLELLSTLPKPKLKVKVPTLFYPGCGTDVLFPLFYVRELWDIEEANFIFLDELNSLTMIKSILDDIGISFSEDKERISFYYDKILIHLKFIHSKIQTQMNFLPKHDIYFERAFRIMRDNIPEYEQKIIAALSNGGVLISDTGFENLPLEYLDVPKQLSSYGEMVMAVKK